MIKSRANLEIEANKTIKLLITTLSIMIVILAIGFFATTTNSAQQGYTLQQQKLKNEHLKIQNINLTTKITQATAFAQIKEEEKIEEMQTIKDKNYVTREDNSVY